MMQAGLDWKSLNTYQAINANTYNVEDIMSIPTSLTRVAVAEEAELLLAAKPAGLAYPGTERRWWSRTLP